MYFIYTYLIITEPYFAAFLKGQQRSNIKKEIIKIALYCLLYILICNYKLITDKIYPGRLLNTEVSTDAISSFSNYTQDANVLKRFEDKSTPNPVPLQNKPNEVITSIVVPRLSAEETMSKIQKQSKELLLIKYSAELSECYSLPYYIHTKTQDYINYKIREKDISWEDIITYVNLGLDHEFYTSIDSIINPSSLTVLVNKYNQLPSDYKSENLEKIISKYSSEALSLRSDARISFEDMCSVARSEDIYLKAISAYRSYNYQAKLYLKKKTSKMTMDEYQKERDRVSARAGHSEHQTGLAVDINSMEQSFGNTTAGIWIAENSYKYGFILRYPNGKEVITGYDYEPWHFRYLGPELAKAVYNSGLSYDEFYIKYIIPSFISFK